MNKLEIVEKQNYIIRTQSELIDELFVLLMQYVTLEEADNIAEKISDVAGTREEW